MSEPLDWRRELEAIAPVTAEERLQDRMQRTRERIAYLNAAGTTDDSWAGDWIDLRADRLALDILSRPMPHFWPRYQPPARPRPRLSWWRRLALVLLGGEA